MTTTIDPSRAWLGKPDPKPMTLLNFLANGHELSDAPGNFLVGIVPPGTSEPVEIEGETPALVSNGYFYEVQWAQGELRTESSWALASICTGNAASGIPTRGHGWSRSDWEVLFLPKRNHPKHQDHLPLSELGMGHLRQALRNVGTSTMFSIYIGATPESLLKCELKYDGDAIRSGFRRTCDYIGDSAATGMLSRAMRSPSSFDTLAPLMWFDAETVKRYAPDFYHAPKVEWSVGDYALTMRGRVVMVSEVDGNDVYAVPATTKESGLVVKYEGGECLSKVDSKLVEELLKGAQA